jgi:UDP:flavonoid glycosyltransferase YjiC (YdhE family)
MATMDTNSSSSSKLHIVIFPWLAFGHLIPGLDLAERIASRGHRVSFVSTPGNIARLPAAMAPHVEFVALPFPRVEGLPDGAESTNDIPSDKFDIHRMAIDGLAAPFSEFLGAACAGNKKKPDWVIIDPFQHWAAAAAVKHKVPCAVLLVGPAGLPATWTTGGQGLKSFPGFKMEAFVTKEVSGISIAERAHLTLGSCNLVAIRSCVEWEPESVPLVTANRVRGRQYVVFGLLPPSPIQAAAVGRGGDPSTPALQWLDAQPASSVVYVALGSEAPLRADQVHELALGLELAGVRFLWALRNPGGVADLLPPGFEERTSGRGHVATGWVPQMRVLAHGAVGAYLTHCGWGSTIEGLLFGHPLIMLPIVADHWVTAHLLESRKVGVQVPRHGDDGSFDREGLATAVRAVTGEEEEGSNIFRANAKKLQKIVADTECHEKYIDQFIQHLRCFNW